MASWRPLGSILEAPGLDFGRFRYDFFAILEDLWSIFSKRSSHRHDAKNAKNAKYVKSAKSFPCMPGAKCGGAAVSPPRGSSMELFPQPHMMSVSMPTSILRQEDR